MWTIMSGFNPGIGWHDGNSQAWKKMKYFTAAGEQGGFSVRIRRNGESRVLTLYRTASTGIERHLKVKGEANLYDPDYAEYFERRLCFAWLTRGMNQKLKTTTAVP
jgi:hypothetical protein